LGEGERERERRERASEGEYTSGPGLH